MKKIVILSYSIGTVFIFDFDESKYPDYQDFYDEINKSEENYNFSDSTCSCMVIDNLEDNLSNLSTLPGIHKIQDIRGKAGVGVFSVEDFQIMCKEGSFDVENNDAFMSMNGESYNIEHKVEFDFDKQLSSQSIFHMMGFQYIISIRK